MKKKGFTLIELLAVIVVLAIIALIATPMVLNTIDEARKGSAKSSGYGYINGLETSLASYMLKNNGNHYSAGKYDVSTLNTDLNVTVKGDAPSEGKVCVASNGTVTKASLKVSGYIVTYDGKEVKNTDLKEVEDITCDGEVALVGDPILDKAKTLVYDDTGVCKTDGSTYNYMDGCYIKGSSTNNYIWYNGFMWRIMGINSDNTVRLITDENVTTLSQGAENTSFSYENEGYIHDWLNEYFYNHLNSTKSIIQEGEYFCSESTNGELIKEGRTTCTIGNEVTTKIGLISLDEYLLANRGYLMNRQYFWAMTPYDISNVWCVESGGAISSAPITYARGVRPVINVKPDAIITGGDGEAQSFYILEEDKQNDITGTISTKVTSGEYVSLEGKIYRVVSKNSDGVKLILDGVYESNISYAISDSGDNKFNGNNYVRNRLNNVVLKWLGLSISDKIVTTTYYQGDEFELVPTYVESLKQSNGTEVKVGLIQVGEILAAQSSTMLTKNYTKPSNTGNVENYWTMNNSPTNPNSSHNGKGVWIVNMTGDLHPTYLTTVAALRPVITVRNDLNITGGTGTWNNPYQI